ncbi:MAG: glutamine amidotransferase [Bauldia sp.]
MADAPKVLIAGESWTTHSTHVKGFDSFQTSTYAEGGTDMIASIRGGGYDVTYQPSHIAAEQFPSTEKDMAAYRAIILSDIGANTLLLPAPSFIRSQRAPANRLALMRDFVANGGGLLMVGGYMTFQGIEGKANYRGSPVEDVLPVTLFAGDDRSERPEGVVPSVLKPDHEVMRGLPAEWPFFLGYSRSTARPDATVVATIGGDPFIALRSVGKGRSAIFSSDCGPHWGPPGFIGWGREPGDDMEQPGRAYRDFWRNLVKWLCG